MKLHLDLNRFALSGYFPERNAFFIREFLHSPSRLEAAGYEMHGNKETDLESLDELSATAPVISIIIVLSSALP